MHILHALRTVQHAVLWGSGFKGANSSLKYLQNLSNRWNEQQRFSTSTDVQDLRRSNFTAADCRNCDFSDSKLQGAYFIKTVLAKANFQVSS